MADSKPSPDGTPESAAENPEGAPPEGGPLLPGMPAPARKPEPYRVLARKYRPQTFKDLVGQEALVRTLTNALTSGRMHHAFILTGVRGVGKTTSARIVARALNCTGPDGKGGPTPEPCGVCDNCRTIAEDRNVDVIEMDAASRTGIDDIREIIDGVRYAPVSTRFKVYIIDEVHMLSKQAFNGLLKTLEEPPPHVKFIFATTEIRKVPVTVLSRCQRFDLRRLDVSELIALFGRILAAEGVTVAPEAVALIARAADGSARDGLSLLDQAIAQSGAQSGVQGGVQGEGGSAIDLQAVQAMLGQADRAVIFDLAEAIFAGEAKAALGVLDRLHEGASEPAQVIEDLLDLVHLLTRSKLVPDMLSAPGLPEFERTRGKALAEALSLPVLTRAWQMLLKGAGEVASAPRPEMALEMVVIRLIHAGMLPTPGDMLKKLQEGVGDDARPAGGTAASGASPSGAQSGARSGAQSGLASGSSSGQARAAADLPQAVGAGAPAHAAPRGGGAARARLAVVEPAAPEVAETAPESRTMATPRNAPEIVPENTPPAKPVPPSFEAMVALFEQRADGLLFNHVFADLHPVRYEPGRLEFRPSERAPRDLAPRIARHLEEWTGRRWMVSVSGEAGEPTMRQREESAQAKSRAEAENHPLVRRIMAAFPGATIQAIRRLDAADNAPPGTGLGREQPLDSAAGEADIGGDDMPDEDDD
ncbi:MAG: DNA polymerase III subunit gamma/tau [Azospirillaceae bacterium]